ncbi:hypothetical protein Tco_1510904 [Tanacetum coccineum]
MYVGGKVNYVDNIDVDLFNVDEVHMFVQDLGYDSKQLIFYHFKLPNKSLDYGLRPLSCDADVVSLINIVETFKVVEVFIEYWLTSVDHHYLSPFKPSVEIKELNDDVELDASVVGQSREVTSSKRLALEYGHKNVNVEDSVCKYKKVEVDEVNVNLNVNEEQTVDVDEVNVNLNVDDYTIDDNYEFLIQDNYDINDYPMDADKNVNADENVNAYENVNADENVNVN